MNEVVFPEKHTFKSEIDLIEFPAVVDGKTITCQITLEKMMSTYACGTPETFEAEFRRLRPQIEARAKEEIQRKKSDNE